MFKKLNEVGSVIIATQQFYKSRPKCLAFLLENNLSLGTVWGVENSHSIHVQSIVDSPYEFMISAPTA